MGPAAESLKTLEPNPPFDFVFIDADWQNMPTYFIEAKRLLRKGGIAVCRSVFQHCLDPRGNSRELNEFVAFIGSLLQIIDNVNRHGKVSNPEYTGADVQGIRDVLEVIKNDTEVEATTMGMAGDKGYDGYMFIVKQ